MACKIGKRLAISVKSDSRRFEASLRQTDARIDFEVWRRPWSEVFGLNSHEICLWRGGDNAGRFPVVKCGAARVS
ncbi:hypothetical protein COLO4_08571 [Corchorus olitorius]|uniref:Uncharacterized protein n=1 Tax=Corchorus olitorius TaxID=93759 RepID=A0A1R3KF96_9ROSI|nr:hypothetical protein COLO4_08571 [Corchorus olitorius]